MKTNPSPDLQNPQLKGNAQLGSLIWNIRERLNLELQMGSGQFKWGWSQDEANFRGRANGGFVWNGQAKIVVLEIKNTSVAGNGQVGGWDWMNGAATIDGAENPKVARTKLRYWQAGVAVTQKIGWFFLYLGCNANQTTFTVQDLKTGPVWLYSETVVGPFAGCTFSNGSCALLSIEWRGWFEEGLSVSGQLRF